MTDLECTRRLRYIHELEGGPKTTGDLIKSLMVTGHSISVMMKKLRAQKIVESTRVVGVRGNMWSHALAEGWQDIYAASTKNSPRLKVERQDSEPTPELLHIAQLRSEGWTGQRLVAKHQEQYPNTPAGRVRYYVALVRKRGMCR